jgi:glycosyltransferase involved in cell wall biosynthesis
MIFFDVTKASGTSHRSGLTRVATRLAEELQDVTPVRWTTWDRTPNARDWFVSAELFSEDERPGLTEFLLAKRCQTAAIFHDAIPLKLPHITWPKSVGRHPGYMKLLSRFDRVWAVSAASKSELEVFWRWQGVTRPPRVDVLSLGADFNRAARVTARPASSRKPPVLLCVGIIEPRKNQSFLLDVCESLWRESVRFELHLVGRVNPHFGAPIVAKIKQLARTHHGALHWHEAASDAALAQLYSSARALVFPTIAEGCGLPLLESLWMGVPCVCSDLPVLRENAAGGGCVSVGVSDTAAWAAALRRVLNDDALEQSLRVAAMNRPLPTWREAAQQVSAALS